MSEAPGPTLPATPRPGYVRAVGPRLRALLYVVFALVALLTANSFYLAAVTGLQWYTGLMYETYFYQLMFLGHLALGILLIGPYLGFGLVHLFTSRKRKNRRAIRIGYALFAAGVAVLVTGVLLMRVGGLDLRHPLARPVVYWLHVAVPFFCAWLYWLHRLVGPRVKWKVGLAFAIPTVALTAVLVSLHSQDPKHWNVAGPASGEQYFHPSLARTATGKFIPSETLLMDDYCLKCHQDAYKGWFHSAHHFSSFNNPAYLASVRETREVALKRDGNVQASRWCAGCHDPVPFFSGAFDDPKFDDVNHSTSQAGITCTACHSITHVNSTKGNADFVIEEPSHYPFARSENPWLRYLNEQLVKAKPGFHKQTFLKPFHKTAEFCSTCHKVHLPYELNKYKEFLRGQNHYDTYLLSGASGHGARSFYYPDKAFQNCASCHMPLQPSGDFGAKFFADATQLSIHDHLFPAANTALVQLRGEQEGIQERVIQAHQKFLETAARVDIFGVKEGGTIDGKLHAPLRPQVPTVKPGETYLLESVVRTLKMGHPFTQGTVDSNEVWIDVTLSSGDQIIGRSGAIDETGTVDPYSHFINVFMLDRDGNRIDRRNPQDIFVPLYNHQIPPGAAGVVHYQFRVPPGLKHPLKVDVRLQYRKFDQRYLEFIAKSAKPTDRPIAGLRMEEPLKNPLLVTTLASDSILLPVEGVDSSQPNPESKIPVWQRWNDYGIGLLLEGSTAGGKGELKQAAEAFAEVEKLGRYDGPLNLARVYFQEGRVDEATLALQRAAAVGSTTDPTQPRAPQQTLSWLSGLINRQQGRLDAAIENFRGALEYQTPETIRRGFDFSRDYEVINELGQAYFERAKVERGPARKEERARYLQLAVEAFQRTLKEDSENVAAHFNLSQLYAQLGLAEKAAEHQKLHARYKPDDNARDIAIAAARKKYPAANLAAENLVIYSLQRAGAPGLPKAEVAVQPAAPAKAEVADRLETSTGGGGQ